MKAKKIKLSPDFDFEIIGISSSAYDYQIAWELTQLFDFEFEKSSDVTIIDEKYSEYQVFNVFEVKDEEEECLAKLISNKANNIGYFCEELKNIDFFLLIFDKKKLLEINDLKKKLKKSKNINAVFIFDIENIKSKEKFIF
jgi:hypothetical protein